MSCLDWYSGQQCWSFTACMDCGHRTSCWSGNDWT